MFRVHVIKLSRKKDANHDLVWKNDANSSRDFNNRKSTASYYFKLNGRSAALCCGVKKQVRFDLPSSEAKYQDMTAVDQEALCLTQLLEDFGFQQNYPIAVEEGSPIYVRP